MRRGAGSWPCLLWHHPDQEFGTPYEILVFLHSVFAGWNWEWGPSFFFFLMCCFTGEEWLFQNFALACLPFLGLLTEKACFFFLFIFYLFFLNLCPLTFLCGWLHSLVYTRQRENWKNLYLISSLCYHIPRQAIYFFFTIQHISMFVLYLIIRF